MRVSRLILALLSWMILIASDARAADSGEKHCQELNQLDFSRTRDVPFTTTGARIVADGQSQPFCQVTGYIVPKISFELRLPLKGWNKGFVLAGSGGWAIEKFLFLCKEPVRRGYACIAGDAGHQIGQGLWMQSNPQTRIDWGYRATHVTTLAGKTLVQAFYGQPPKLSLMIGASTGGYQALVEAQRFPWDFAGIIAVAPDMDEAGLAMRTEWTTRHLSAENGQPLFSSHDLMVLHQAVLRACDVSDGVRDGIVGDPLGCRFDPRSIACEGRTTSNCLTPRQVTAAERIYAGPTTSAGERLTAGGLLPGSELGWAEIAKDKFPDQFFQSALADAPRDGFPAKAFDFDEDYKRLGLAGTLIDSNPDLRRFEQAGGKLLLVQGGNDTTEQVPVLVDYYRTVERVAGGHQLTEQFARLFIVPGMNHATGGDGAFAIDYLTPMERWVTDGQPPAVLVGAHVPEWESELRGMLAGLTSPKAGQDVTFTRPIFPYPAHAVFIGKGDMNDFRNFVPVESEAQPKL